MTDRIMYFLIGFLVCSVGLRIVNGGDLFFPSILLAINLVMVICKELER